MKKKIERLLMENDKIAEGENAMEKIRFVKMLLALNRQLTVEGVMQYVAGGKAKA